MDRQAALDHLASTHQGILITLKADGRPQSSNVAYTVDGDRVRISVMEASAKVANLRRDPRASLHVTPDFRRYAVYEGTVALSPVSSTPGDAVGQELLEVYDLLAGPHPDPEEFFRAMVDDRRLVVTLPVERAYGYLP